MEWEKRRFFAYAAASAYQVISEEIENHIFFGTHVCINNPYWESSGIMILLLKYSSDISNALVGSFMNVLFFVAGFNIIRASWEPKKE